MQKQELAKKIYEIAHITGEFKLRSGITSNEYFDKYQFESEPILLKEIVIQFKNIINFDFDALAGLEVGGIPIAAVLGVELLKPIVYVRKKAKEYGTAKLIEGISVKSKELLIVEDVVTSGGQIVTSVNDLRRDGAVVNKAICVIDREQGGREALLKAGIELFPLFTMSELKSNI